jgi:hypothetical protein
VQIKQQPCVRCGAHGTTKSVKTLALAPEVLIISLQRFVHMGFYQSKANDLIDFPVDGLDMTDFMDSQAGYFESGWNQNPVYDLAVMIEHDGTNQTKNKYIAVARHMPEDKWFEYDDQIVREVSVGMVRKREALMLFYVKRKPVHSMTGKGTIQEQSDVELLQKRMRSAVLDRQQRVTKEKEFLKLRKRVNLEAAQRTLNKNAFGIRSFAMAHSSGRDASFGERLSTKFESMKKKHIKSKSGSTLKLSSKSKWRIVKASLPKIVLMKPDLDVSNALTTANSVTESSSQNCSRDAAPPLQTGNSRRMSTLASFKNKLRIPIFGIRNKINPNGIMDALDEKHYLISDDLTGEDQTYVSYMWIIKFLSLSNPGPMCNDDIVCAHGHLKPNMHGCKKIACVPVHVGLVKKINEYLTEQYGYPPDCGTFRHLRFDFMSSIYLFYY